MAQIHATAAAVVATAKALLALADDPSEVEFTHGPDGAMFIVSDALADKLVAMTDDDTTVTEQEKPTTVTEAPAVVPVELEKPDGTPVQAPPVAPERKINPRAKVTTKE